LLVSGCDLQLCWSRATRWCREKELDYQIRVPFGLVDHVRAMAGPVEHGRATAERSNPINFETWIEKFELS
jgi:hypothetical protein